MEGTEPELDAAAEEDCPALLLSVGTAVVDALVSTGALLLPAAELPEDGEPVSTGGTEIGWPAAEHWETTTLDTAGIC